MTIPSESILYFQIVTAVGILAPILISVLYVLLKKEKITTVLIGAATFFVFAMILEAIPKYFLFQMPSPVSQAIMSNPWLLSIVGALLAGVFEEVGRFIAFKFLLKNRTEKSTAIAYGLGHGLVEVLIILGIAGIQYLAYISMIKSGQFDLIVAQMAAISPEQAQALEAIPVAIASSTLSLLPLAIIERAGAVLYHVGASIIVFDSVHTPKRGWMLLVAILIHTLLDILAGLGQTGVITNLYVLEAIIVLYGLAVFVIAKIKLGK